MGEEPPLPAPLSSGCPAVAGYADSSGGSFVAGRSPAAHRAVEDQLVGVVWCRFQHVAGIIVIPRAFFFVKLSRCPATLEEGSGRLECIAHYHCQRCRLVRTLR